MFRAASLLTFATLAVTVYGQQAGNLTTETHPKLPWQLCRKGGSCTNQSSGEVVLDSNWRWLHHTSNYTNCYDGNEWNTQFCPDNEACAKNCAVDGADYRGTYGITVSGNALTLKFVTEGEYSTNIGSRVYMMNGATKYQLFKLLNKEFTFDVDLSGLPCGLNGALYFVEMPEDGGTKGSNKAGAKFGTGYCDAQCPHDMKFIDGAANVEGWQPSATDQNAGTGKYGTCCAEMDIWEANSMGTAYTPHTCNKNGLFRCSSPQECGDTDSGNRYDGTCDKDGCDFNSFRMGEKKFYGRGSGFTIDSTKKMTVVTQFITTDGTDNGDLKEIRRAYVQGGKTIWNSKANIPGMEPYDSVHDDFCVAQKKAFGDKTHFLDIGGHKAMGDSMKRGMVLALSLWGDHAAHMLWLDSSYPLDKDPSEPGVARGECATDSGDPADLEKNSPGATVIFSNIKFGDLNSTFTP